MSHRLKAVDAMQEWNGWLGLGKLWQLFSISALAIAATGCSFRPSLDVLAYDACVARHPQEPAVCEGPRQAYELDPIALQARADAVSPPVGSDYAKR